MKHTIWMAIAITTLSLLAFTPPGHATENPGNPCVVEKPNACNPDAMKKPNACNPDAMMHGNPCNPDAMKKPNACNPDAMKKPNTCNPDAMTRGNPCNPDAMKKPNPCNPDAMTQQGNACNPDAMKKPNPCNPDAMTHSNPCNPDAMKKPNACKPRTSAKGGKGFKSFSAAVDRGEKLWNDTKLGTNGLSCLSGGCHAKFENMHFNKNQTFPHLVSMAGKVVTVTQMINYCLVNPMAGSALEADSDDMTAMSAFLRAYRMRYRQAARAYRQNRRR